MAKAIIHKKKYLPFHIRLIYTTLTIVDLAFVYFLLMYFLVELFNFKVVNLYDEIGDYFLQHISIFSTVSSIIASVCLAIFPILLSIDNNSLLTKIKYYTIKHFIRNIGILFVTALLFAFTPIFTYKISNNLNVILFVYFVILVAEFIRLYTHFYVIICLGIKYRRLSIKANSGQQQHVLDLVKQIYDRQSKN